MTPIPDLTLADGTTLPAVGLGTYPLRDDDAERAVAEAIRTGYRLIDSAVNYGNEEAVGRGIAHSGVGRDDIVVTTKLPGRFHGYEDAVASIEQSVTSLGVDRIDLHLIHWPNPSVGRYVEAWRAMRDLRDRGLIRSIGVSNFTREHLARLVDETGEAPVVNQIELHPYFPQTDLLEHHRSLGIVTEAWSPLGKGSPVLREDAVTRPASRLGVTPAQVVLRWHLQRGVVPLPKSGDPDRQRQNLDISGFELTDAEVEAITGLGRPDGRLFGGDPNTHEEM